VDVLCDGVESGEASRGGVVVAGAEIVRPRGGVLVFEELRQLAEQQGVSPAEVLRRALLSTVYAST
jgi:hypothetical protein